MERSRELGQDRSSGGGGGGEVVSDELSLDDPQLRGSRLRAVRRGSEPLLNRRQSHHAFRRSYLLDSNQNKCASKRMKKVRNKSTVGGVEPLQIAANASQRGGITGED